MIFSNFLNFGLLGGVRRLRPSESVPTHFCPNDRPTSAILPDFSYFARIFYIIWPDFARIGGHMPLHPMNTLINHRTQGRREKCWGRAISEFGAPSLDVGLCSLLS